MLIAIFVDPQLLFCLLRQNSPVVASFLLLAVRRAGTTTNLCYRRLHAHFSSLPCNLATLVSCFLQRGRDARRSAFEKNGALLATIGRLPFPAGSRFFLRTQSQQCVISFVPPIARITGHEDDVMTLSKLPTLVATHIQNHPESTHREHVCKER